MFGQVNNHKPTFDHSSYTFNIVENNYTNDKMKLGVLRARDEDIGRNGLVEYLISSNVASGNVFLRFLFIWINDLFTHSKLFVFGYIYKKKFFCLLNLDFPFSIDVHTGELFAQGFIDREQKEIYTFEVTVRISFISFRSINWRFE